MILSTFGLSSGHDILTNYYNIQWTPLIKLALGPAQSESYNRMNFIGKVGKGNNNFYYIYFMNIVLLHILLLF